MTMIHLDDPEGRYSQGNTDSELEKKEKRKERRARCWKRLKELFGKVPNAVYWICGVITAVISILSYLGITPNVIRSYLVNGE